ncbi:CHAD domain-containing protein [Thiomicrorhabdus xiamenensis]|uniref:CHAD domain-containing protein n=1 Tax=Thiomicrorhabdus xiamenensis TaxID=2739063 RepID=A0A7D4T1U1_9GAMM|nr:CHAD domain-containing protein [Thiomicrorhabdus xiamenensis]QKI89805.1 CHAD domain-containing protein [Thiomicrorhabdus xiamenensis]
MAQKLYDQLVVYLELENVLQEQEKTLHELRVSARKLVSLLPKDDYHREFFKRVIQASNKIRDLDVLMLQVVPGFPKDMRDAGDQLRKELLGIRNQLDDDFKNFLQLDILPELCNLRANFTREKDSLAVSEGVEELEQIEKQFRQIRKRLLLVDLEEKQVHKIRLKVKRLRYQVAHHYRNKNKLLAELKFLQEQLGKFHDFSQAGNLIRKYAVDLDPEFLKQLRKHLQSKQNAILKKVRKSLK